MMDIPSPRPRTIHEPRTVVYSIDYKTKVIAECPGVNEETIHREVKCSTPVIDTGNPDIPCRVMTSLPRVDTGSMQ
ncbi:MAG: hypothetical protein M0Q92_07125 [Methanoregula sp.]|nr:hypothetical protein [Methanoregula sp.]